MERKNDWFWKTSEIANELGLEQGDIGLFCLLNDVTPDQAKFHFQRQEKWDWSKYGF
jgi:hypothetical protein